MSAVIPVLKDETAQQPVPTAWRETIYLIVKAFVEGNYRPDLHIEGVHRIPEQIAQRIAQSIGSYGAVLKELPVESWDSSVCQWMRGYWDVLIDLFTVEEGRSDLVLSLRVTENGSTFGFEVQSVYVP